MMTTALETIPVDEEGATLLRAVAAAVWRLQQGLPFWQGFGVLVARRRQFVHEVRHDLRGSLHVRGAVRPRITQRSPPAPKKSGTPSRLIPSLSRALPKTFVLTWTISPVLCRLARYPQFWIIVGKGELLFRGGTEGDAPPPEARRPF